jgi:hypothetical protein
MADELVDRPYLVIDGVDGRGHYVTLRAGTDLSELPVGGVVEVRAPSERVADRNIQAMAADGLYRTDIHLAALRFDAPVGVEPDELLAGHVRRLEALRRAGIVERVADGMWRVPNDLVERGKAYDRQRLGSVDVVLHSHLPLERQVSAMGATWLDRQLVGARTPLAREGFGAAVHDALAARARVLIHQGLGERHGDRVSLPRNLLTTLRDREVEAIAKTIAAETGLAYRPVADGTSASGVYRRSVMLASGRFAMLDDGLGFSLVPWQPVVERRLGQVITAVVRGDHVAWQLGRSLGR